MNNPFSNNPAPINLKTWQIRKIKTSPDNAAYHAKNWIKRRVQPTEIMIDSISNNRYNSYEIINKLILANMEVPMKLYRAITEEPLAFDGVDWLWNVALDLYERKLKVPDIIVDALLKHKNEIWWYKHKEDKKNHKILNDIFVKGLSWRANISKDDLEAIVNL